VGRNSEEVDVATDPRLVQFGRRLRELRQEAGLTQTELAERAGVKRDAVARWERGAREPGWFNVVALAEALGVDCLAFLVEPGTDDGSGEDTKGRTRKRRG
jgi:putative transcriptional regulator